MIPVTRPFLPPREEYEALLDGIWDRIWLTNNGPLVHQFEEQVAARLELARPLYVASGTLALQLAMKALGLEGDVVTTPFSYVATTSALVWEGCTPVFADIEPGTFTIDPAAVDAADHAVARRGSSPRTCSARRATSTRSTPSVGHAASRSSMTPRTASPRRTAAARCSRTATPAPAASTRRRSSTPSKAVCWSRATKPPGTPPSACATSVTSTTRPSTGWGSMPRRPSCTPRWASAISATSTSCSPAAVRSTSDITQGWRT